MSVQPTSNGDRLKPQKTPGKVLVPLFLNSIIDTVLCKTSNELPHLLNNPEINDGMGEVIIPLCFHLSESFTDNRD